MRSKDPEIRRRVVVIGVNVATRVAMVKLLGVAGYEARELDDSGVDPDLQDADFAVVDRTGCEDPAVKPGSQTLVVGWICPRDLLVRPDLLLEMEAARKHAAQILSAIAPAILPIGQEGAARSLVAGAETLRGIVWGSQGGVSSRGKPN